MFGLGLAEIAVIVIVALLVFGPDKLPSLARQAAQFIRSMRQMADNAKSDLSREFGSDFSDLDLRSMDPREVVRRTLLDSEGHTPATAPDQGATKPVLGLRPGENPPFDNEAT